MKNLVLTLALLLTTIAASAQAVPGSAEKLRILKPPAGAKVAIIAFEDFECPDCGHAHPVLVEAAKKFNIPYVRYDFPLPQHPYAFQAAIMNRYLVSKNPALASQFRDEVYKNQPQFADDAQRFIPWAMKWASDHGTPFPFVIDPDGKFAALIKADQDLGRRINIEHTPTIYIVTSARSTEPFVEVVDRSQLYQMIEDAQHQAASAAPEPAGTKLQGSPTIRKPSTKK